MTDYYVVETDLVNPFYEEDRPTVDFMSSCKGFIGLNNEIGNPYSMWVYDTEKNARTAMRLALSQGIDCQDIRVISEDAIPVASA